MSVLLFAYRRASFAFLLSFFNVLVRESPLILIRQLLDRLGCGTGLVLSHTCSVKGLDSWQSPKHRHRSVVPCVWKSCSAFLLQIFPIAPGRGGRAAERCRFAICDSAKWCRGVMSFLLRAAKKLLLHSTVEVIQPFFSLFFQALS